VLVLPCRGPTRLWAVALLAPLSGLAAVGLGVLAGVL
jgi:hypothetical protein